MLSFFKKTVSSPSKRKSQRTNVAESLNPSSPTNGYIEPAESPSPLPSPTVSFTVFDEDNHFLDDDECTYVKERSRLSKTLSEVLADKAALAYFTQYLESRENALPYIRCWLDIDHLQQAITMHLKNNNHDQQRTSSPSCSSNGNNDVAMEHDSLSVSTDSSSGSVWQDFTDDALRIFKRYVALEAAEGVSCTDDMRNTIVENICNSSKTIESEAFDAIQKHVFEYLDGEYFEAFLGSDYFCKYQIDVLTSGNIVLDDILYNETALFYFMEFLEQEGNRHLLEFWLAATNLQQQLQQQKDFFDPIEAQNDAVVLYDKYFSLQAHCPLGFNDKVRFALEQNICGEEGLMLDCFAQPLRLVEQLLQRNFLKSFINSQLFYKYLSELINTVQSSGYATSLYERQRKPGSDCSSEKSFSTNSTFLALEMPAGRGGSAQNNSNSRRERTVSDMNIDARHLYDPDSLWKRKRHSRRLSFGHVTELGKFVRDFDTDVNRNSGALKLRDVVRKFVSLDEDRNKEEMAWQVAEMIVKDITNVTLNEHKT